ncbi:MAG: helix-turn-helix transcriptional regulator [Rhizobiaceae bacterium]
MSLPSAPLFLTERELAQRWALSAKTLRNWRVSGLGPPFVKIGGAVRYSLDAVEAFESEQARSSTGARP